MDVFSGSHENGLSPQFPSEPDAEPDALLLHGVGVDVTVAVGVLVRRAFACDVAVAVGVRVCVAVGVAVDRALLKVSVTAT